MTDRVRVLTVMLERDMRVDDAAEVVDAICMIRGVDSVDVGPVVNLAEEMARLTARRELVKELREVLR